MACLPLRIVHPASPSTNHTDFTCHCTSCRSLPHHMDINHLAKEAEPSSQLHQQHLPLCLMHPAGPHSQPYGHLPFGRGGGAQRPHGARGCGGPHPARDGTPQRAGGAYLVYGAHTRHLLAGTLRSACAQRTWQWLGSPRFAAPTHSLDGVLQP
jgi:hypothetical protein